MRMLRPRRRVTALWWASTLVLVAAAMGITGCGSSSDPQRESAATDGGAPRVLAVETFLADIARNIAGDKMAVASLIPVGTDPHGFELTPADAVRVAECDVLILNGAGLEPSLEEMAETIGGQAQVIEASAGLVSRTPREGEEAPESEDEMAEGEEHHHHDQGDPHFWLDPNLVVKYVENIRDGLSRADPSNASTYKQNAAEYVESLSELDAWISHQVADIPSAERQLVTNHESFGYFADRYGFQVVGTVMPSVSASASPSSQQLAGLVAVIRETGVPAIFLETGSDPRLAEQVAAETGVKVVTEIYSHSLTDTDGAAPTYIDMMKANTKAIVEALRRP